MMVNLDCQLSVIWSHLWDRSLGVSFQNFPNEVDGGRECTLNVIDWYPSVGGSPGCVKRRNVDERQPASLSFLTMNTM